MLAPARRAGEVLKHLPIKRQSANSNEVLPVKWTAWLSWSRLPLELNLADSPRFLTSLTASSLNSRLNPRLW